MSCQTCLRIRKVPLCLDRDHAVDLVMASYLPSCDPPSTKGTMLAAFIQERKPSVPSSSQFCPNNPWAFFMSGARTSSAVRNSNRHHLTCELPPTLSLFRAPRCVELFAAQHWDPLWCRAGDIGLSWAQGGGDGAAESGSRGGAVVGAGKTRQGDVKRYDGHRRSLEGGPQNDMYVFCLAAIREPHTLHSLQRAGCW